MKQVKLVVFFALFASFKAIGQDIMEVPTPLSMMTLSVMEDMYLSMELDPSTMFALMLQQPNDKAEELMFNSLDLIRGMIKDSTGVDILPANTLEGKVKFSRLGLPLVTLKKAAKKSDFQQYVKIDISVSPFSGTTTTNTVATDSPLGVEVGSSNYSASWRPEVFIIMKFADANGKSIKSIRGIYRHTDEVKVTSEDLVVAGWQFPMNQEAEVIPYYYFLEKAVEDLIGKLKS